MHYAIGSVTSQSKRIPCSDWLLKSTLHAQDYGEKTLNGFGHLLNPLLTKSVRSRQLDIGHTLIDVFNFADIQPYWLHARSIIYKSLGYWPGVSMGWGLPLTDPVPLLLLVCSHAMCWNVKNTWCFSVSWVGSFIFTCKQTNRGSSQRRSVWGSTIHLKRVSSQVSGQ